MMGPSHLLFGALCGATYAAATGESALMVGLVAVTATAVSHGPSSPDMDHTDTWNTLVPPRLRTHRYGASHWFGWPLIAWLIVMPHPWREHLAFLPTITDREQALAAALLLGWSSHLLGDFIFGHLALYPWGGRKFGLGLKTDGWIERARFGISPLRTVLAIALLWTLWIRPTAADWSAWIVEPIGNWIGSVTPW